VRRCCSRPCPRSTTTSRPIAPRGRYNAINSAAFQGGAITGPIAAGLLLGNDLDALFIAVMVIGCVGIGVLALALERRLPATANGEVTTSSEASTPRTEPR
jgi:MFS family permease